MRQHLVGAAIAAFAAMAVPASAADMAVKALPPPAPIFNWTGFYIGGEVGGLWGQADGTLIFPPVATYSNRNSTGIGGGFVGFQYQWNKLVLGVEANVLGLFEQDLGRSSCSPLGACTAGATIGNRWGDGIWTVGGRAGIAAGMWMPYVAGGYAATRVSNTGYNAAGAIVESFSQDRSGWYAGVGVDYAFTPNWIAGLEYRHYDFATARGIPIIAGGVPVPADTTDLKVKADTVVARLSYKFGVAGPVVAKY